MACLFVSVLFALPLITAPNARGATSAVSVTATVASATAITNQCTAAPASTLPAVLPGGTALTDTGAGACRFTFQSSNDTVQLRVYQRDRSGSSLTQTSTALETQLPWQNEYVRSIDAADGSTAYAVSPGVLLSTVDGGANWASYTTGIWESFTDVAAAPGTAGTAYAVGSAGVIYKTTNSGGSWVAQTSGTTTAIQSVSAVDANTVFAVGDDGLVLETLDGGANWSVKPSGITGIIYAVAAVDANTVWAAGSGGRVWKSTDGADSWTLQATLGGWLLSLAAVDANTAVAGGDGYIATTTDGTNWSTVSGFTQANIRAVDFAGAGTVWIAGDRGEVYRSTDGAATFSRLVTSPGSQYYGVSAVSATSAFVAGSASAILRTDDTGASWTSQRLVPSAQSWNSLDVIGADSLVAVGGGGRISTTANGGTTWTSRTSNTDVTLWSADMASATVGYAVGEEGTVLKTLDGGVSWSAVPTPTSEGLRDVAAVDAQTLWVVGEAGTVLRSTDGGSSWSQLSLGTTDRLVAVSAVGSDHAWVARNYDRVYRTTNAGASWASTDPCACFLRDVSAASSDVVYVGGRWMVHKSTDGGATFSDHDAGVQPTAVLALDERHVVVGSSWGAGVRSSDGGATWFGAGNMNMDHFGVAAADINTVWFGSEAGTITKTSTPSSVSDYGLGSNWASDPSTSMFGACLQSIGATTVAGDWAPDGSGVVGTCEASDDDPWYAVPSAPVRIGSTAAAGAEGEVTLVFGFRPASNTPAGRYRAHLAFEAIAPNT